MRALLILALNTLLFRPTNQQVSLTNNPSGSADYVGGNHGATANFLYPDGGMSASMGADFNFNSFMWGALPFPS